jgi:hypothetical protein
MTYATPHQDALHVLARSLPTVRLGTIVRWVMLFGATSFIYLTMRDGWGEIRSSMAALVANEIILVTAALLLEVAWTWALAQVYRSSLVAFGGRARHRDALRVSMGAFTLSRVLPGGGTVGGLFAAKEFIAIGNSGALTLVSMVTAGWVSLVSLTAIVATGVGFGVAVGLVSPSYLILPLAVFGGLLGVGLAAVLAVRHRKPRQRVAAFLGRLFGGWGGGMTAPEVEATLESAAGSGLVRLAPVGFWAALSWILDAAALWLVFAAFGHPLSLGALAVGYGLANLLQALPEMTPGWLGVLEGTLAVTYAAFGVPLGVAAVAVLGYRVLSFWLPVAAGVPFGLGILRKHGRRPALEVAS